MGERACEGCEVCELASELADERALAQSLAARLAAVETELAEALARAEIAYGERVAYAKRAMDAEAELSAVRAERDEARQALRHIGVYATEEAWSDQERLIAIKAMADHTLEGTADPVCYVCGECRSSLEGQDV